MADIWRIKRINGGYMMDITPHTTTAISNAGESDKNENNE